MSLIAYGGVHPQSPFGTQDSGLVVEPDETCIYESGNLYRVRIDDLVQNPVAVRQMVNDLNASKKELRELRRTSLSATAAVFYALFNVLGLTVLAIGVNLVTEAGSWVGVTLIVAGALVSVLSAAAPAIAAVSGARKPPTLTQPPTSMMSDD